MKVLSEAGRRIKESFARPLEGQIFPLGEELVVWEYRGLHKRKGAVTISQSREEGTLLTEIKPPKVSFNRWTRRVVIEPGKGNNSFMGVQASGNQRVLVTGELSIEYVGALHKKSTIKARGIYGPVKLVPGKGKVSLREIREKV